MFLYHWSKWHSGSSRLAFKSFMYPSEKERFAAEQTSEDDQTNSGKDYDCGNSCAERIHKHENRKKEKQHST